MGRISAAAFQDTYILRHFLDHGTAELKLRCSDGKPLITWELLELGIGKDSVYGSINETITGYLKASP